MEVKEFVRGLNRDEKIKLFEYLKNDLNNQTDLKKLKATINKEQKLSSNINSIFFKQPK